MAAPASSEPRVRVAAVILIDGRVILVRQRKGGAAYHLLPGGGVALGETLEAALLREIREETGLECSIGGLLLVNDTIAPDSSRHLVNVTFAAHIIGEQLDLAPTDPAIEGIELVPLTDLPALDLRPPIADELLKALQGASARYIGPVWTDE